MPAKRPNQRPGDLILDRYMPDATPEERETARENLKTALAALMCIEEQRALRNGGKLDSQKQQSRGRVDTGASNPDS